MSKIENIGLHLYRLCMTVCLTDPEWCADFNQLQPFSISCLKIIFLTWRDNNRPECLVPDKHLPNIWYESCCLLKYSSTALPLQKIT